MFRARSQVHPDEEEAKPVLSITDRKAAAAKKLSALMRKRRRSYRLCCFVMFAGFLALIWLLAVLPFMRLEATKTFADTGSFSIELDGCDLDFVPGTKHKVTYAAAYAAFQMEWTNSETDADTPIGAAFANNLGCEEQPLSSCRYLCLVTVTVPPDSEVEFEVEQSDLDAGGVTNWPLVTVRPGARLASLQVGEWFGYQQTLAVTVDNATVGDLGTYLVRGDVRAHNATLGAVSAISSGTGSIYLLDVAATGADVALNYRQPDGRVCIASDLDPTQAAFITLTPTLTPTLTLTLTLTLTR